MDRESRQDAPIAEVAIAPSDFDVYSPTTVRVSIRPREAIKAGSVIACQLPNSFLAFRISQSHTQRLQCDDAAAPHYVSVEMPDIEAVSFDVEVASRELITDTGGRVRHGQRMLATACGGDVPAAAEVVFTFSQMYSPWVANQTEYFLVEIDGTPVEPWPTFSVRPGPAVWQRLIVPSCAKPGEPFRVLLVSLDEYDNVSSSSYSDVSLAAEDGDVLKVGIAFEGRYETQVSLPRKGIYRLIATGTLGDFPLADGESAEGLVSNAIRITDDPVGPYWGDIHVHTHVSCDAVGNEPYEYAKDVSGLDFAGVCDHCNAQLPEQWERIKQWARDHYESGRFVTILGYEGGVAGKSFHHNVYYPDLNVCFDDATFVGDTHMTEEALREHLAKHGALSQLHQSGTCSTDMCEPYFESTRLIEIYSHWGQSEYYNPDHALAYEANRVRTPETRLTISGRGPFYARDAWALGKRYVTVGSSDDHSGQAGRAHRGVTAVYSDELTREGVFAALKNGACYATTGERILLDFRVNGRPMGSELEAQPGEELTFSVEIYGTNALCVVEAFRYRFGGEADWETAFAEEFPDRGLKGGQPRDLITTWTEMVEGSAVYYLRARQKHLVKDRPVYAWSTPIWVMSNSCCGRDERLNGARASCPAHVQMANPACAGQDARAPMSASSTQTE